MLSTCGYATQFQKVEMMKILDGDGNHMVTAADAGAYYNSIFTASDKYADDSVDANEWVAKLVAGQ